MLLSEFSVNVKEIGPKLTQVEIHTDTYASQEISGVLLLRLGRVEGKEGGEGEEGRR